MVLKKYYTTSDQDAGTSRYTLPPHTTKRRTTTNLKIKNNQNCQKIKLYRSLTTKELKKKHSPRPVGGVETSSWAEGTLGKVVAGGPGEGAAAGRLGGPTFTCGQTRRNNWGMRQTIQSRVPGREIRPQTSDCKHLWGLRRQQEKLPASQESSLERPTGS